jgi:type II secretory pathway component PulM
MRAVNPHPAVSAGVCALLKWGAVLVLLGVYLLLLWQNASLRRQHLEEMSVLLERKRQVVTEYRDMIEEHRRRVSAAIDETKAHQDVLETQIHWMREQRRLFDASSPAWDAR